MTSMFVNRYLRYIHFDLGTKTKRVRGTASLKTRSISRFQIEDVVIVEDLAKWQDLVNERDALKWKLEHANVSFYSHCYLRYPP